MDPQPGIILLLLLLRSSRHARLSGLLLWRSPQSAAVTPPDPTASLSGPFDFTFSLDSNLGVHSPYNPDLSLPAVTFGFFFFSKLKVRLARRTFTKVQDLSKAVRHFRAQRYTRFSIPICSSDVAEAANKSSGQWRDELSDGL